MSRAAPATWTARRLRASRRAAAAAATAVAAAAAAMPGDATAQYPPPAGGTIYLEAGHWAVAAARRLEAAGLAPHGYDPGFRTPTRGAVLDVFRSAAERAPERAPAMAVLADAYLERLLEEFPGLAGGDTTGRREWVHEVQGGAGFERLRGRLVTGHGYRDESWLPEADWQGPTPRPDETGGVAAGSWTVAFARAGLLLAPMVDDDGFRVASLQATGALGPVVLSAGRMAPGYGAGFGGAIVLTGSVPFDGLGVALREPLRLPGPFRHVGPIRFETYVSRVDENGPRRRPWFWGARGSLSPHPRVRLGVSRAAMFAGESDDPRIGSPPVNLRNLAYLIIGKHAGAGSEFENQVVAVDLRVRPPVGDLPLALYLEWGMADGSGGWKNVPARTAGAELAALPGLPQASLAVERTHFEPECCGNPIWYRNFIFWGGWADGGEPLGHPLGGHGVEWLLHARADLMDAALRIGVRAFTRDRGEENLYAPDWIGRSRGVALSGRWRPNPHLELLVNGGLETRDEGTSTSELTAGFRVLR